MIDEGDVFDPVMDQARLFHARERTRSFRDITKGMFRKIAVPVDYLTFENPFAAGDEARPVTVHTRIRINGATPTGFLFGIGDGDRSFCCWLDGAGKIHAGAGDLGTSLPTVSNDGAHVEQSVSGVDGNLLDVVVACSPGSGVIGMWIDGKLSRAVSVSSRLRGGLWALDPTQIYVMNEMNSPPTMCSGIGVPSNFVAVAPVSFFTRQTPQHFLAKR